MKVSCAWHADPDATGADRELALFGTTGYQQDREGLGIYDLEDGTGYIVSVDQLPGESVFHIYRREGESERPHHHSAVMLSFTGGADGTDGLEEGLPYQTLIANLLHKYASGRLREG